MNLASAGRPEPLGDVEPRHAPRSLPIRVDPLPQEGLDSWLEALARHTDATWGEILRAIGIAGTRGNTASYWAVGQPNGRPGVAHVRSRGRVTVCRLSSARCRAGSVGELALSRQGVDSMLP